MLGEIDVVFVSVRRVYAADLRALLARTTGESELHLTLRMIWLSLVLAKELFGQNEHLWLHVLEHEDVLALLLDTVDVVGDKSTDH